MKVLAIIAAAIFGIAAGCIVSKSDPCLDLTGRALGRGRLLGHIGDNPIFAADISNDAFVVDTALAVEAGREHARAADTRVSENVLLLRTQARDDAMWRQFFANSGLDAEGLRVLVTNWLSSREFVEMRVGDAARARDDESRQFYEDHPESFVLPPRLRASHIFVAAPKGTSPDVIAAKQRAINGMAQAVKRGADFAQTAATGSEDEATKGRGGDLGWLSEARVPRDFFDAVRLLRPAETSPVFKTALGFHIVRLTDSRPPRMLAFDEVRRDVALLLANQSRQKVATNLQVELVEKHFRLRGGKRPHEVAPMQL